MDNTIDTANKCLVALQGRRVVMLNPQSRMTADEAMVFAAWLVVIAEIDATITFEQAKEAVSNT